MAARRLLFLNRTISKCFAISGKRSFHSSLLLCKEFNQPVPSKELTRAGGIATVFRLPFQETTDGLDACFVGIPLDNGATNRSGARFGPRQIRTESAIVRGTNPPTGALPFSSIMVADVGDIGINIFNLEEACKQIRAKMSELIQNKCIPLTMGGDHTISYPILQAMKDKYGPVGLIHVDAHTDLYGPMLNSKIHHGNPFLLAVQEGCLDTKRVIQIGLRGSGHQHDYDTPRELGFRIVPAHECYHKSLIPLMEEVRQMMGDGPVYISFDIDALDPAFAPGTGTPEIGGLTSIQGLEILRGCKGLNIVGGDLVEVSPPYDTTGTTALHGANLLFEMLCVLPGVKYRPI